MSATKVRSPLRATLAWTGWAVVTYHAVWWPVAFVWGWASYEPPDYPITYSTSAWNSAVEMVVAVFVFGAPLTAVMTLLFAPFVHAYVRVAAARPTMEATRPRMLASVLLLAIAATAVSLGVLIGLVVTQTDGRITSERGSWVAFLVPVVVCSVNLVVPRLLVPSLRLGAFRRPA